ncbi:hypothetical protein [Chryseobacterium sp. MMS23-Vi53]|uniref:hypothetical protein n=1 Tax=Chryseobacterium sp. MMS23-Vi53 TaxID=3386644 RepID=UPI0039EB0F71
MEKNEITPREQLKTYFQKGKYPTQGQFSELIDSLKHKEDPLTQKEAVAIANSFLSLNTGYIYYTTNIGNQKFSVVVNSSDEDEQEIVSTTQGQGKVFFYGSAPYTIKAKKFPVEGLNGNEYYVLSYQVNSRFYRNMLFGNNLPSIPDGFEFGTLEDNMFNLSIGKLDIGQQVNIVNTQIKFINNTSASIQYRAQAGYWSDKYRAEDSVTNHYDISDTVSFTYDGDLTEIHQGIECKIFDTTNNNLLMTAFLSPTQNNQGVWGGGQLQGIRNIRIECDYKIL